MKKNCNNLEKPTGESSNSATGTSAQLTSASAKLVRMVIPGYINKKSKLGDAKLGRMVIPGYTNKKGKLGDVHVPGATTYCSNVFNDVEIIKVHKEARKVENINIKVEEKSIVDMGFTYDKIKDWENMEQCPKQSLYRLLKDMIENYTKTDVQIRIGQVCFKCHLMVLQCYSEFFYECSNEKTIELAEENICPGAFMMVYDWMVDKKPLVRRVGTLKLLKAANFLRIKELIHQCHLYLNNDCICREDTAFMLYLEAKCLGMENIAELMMSRICKFFLTLVSCKEYVELSFNEICSLLSSNTIGVNSEIEIFMSMVRWLNHSWNEREAHMLEIAKCIRFSLMPAWYLISLTKNTDCMEIDRITCHSEVLKCINDAIIYQITQMYYGDNREELKHLLDRYQLTKPVQRQWIYDKDCSYHHSLQSPNFSVTYASFLDYLEMIKEIGLEYWKTLELVKAVDTPVQKK